MTASRSGSSSTSSSERAAAATDRPERLRPATQQEVMDAVRAGESVMPVGAATKPALIPPTVHATRLDMTGLAGLIEYEPQEFTFTAYAGTPLRTIVDALAENGQYLPFDPPLVQAGATLGGTIAAGLSGSGRHRYGGLRDFILGVHIVDGRGRLTRGGGKVVKNAAGFDLPKLMAGSLGRLGVIVRASFKVFPAPPATATFAAVYPDMDAAVAATQQLMTCQFDLEAVDLAPGDWGTNGDQNDSKTRHENSHAVTLLVQVGGPESVLPQRIQRLCDALDTGTALPDEQAADIWRDNAEFRWCPSEFLLVKVPATLHALPQLDEALAQAGAQRRYAVGGSLAWIGWPQRAEQLSQLLQEHQCSGLVLRGETPTPLLGTSVASPMRAMIRQALDPDHRFPDYE